MLNQTSHNVIGLNATNGNEDHPLCSQTFQTTASKTNQSSAAKQGSDRYQLKQHTNQIGLDLSSAVQQNHWRGYPKSKYFAQLHQLPNKFSRQSTVL
jgi:hypothetical protein